MQNGKLQTNCTLREEMQQKLELKKEERRSNSIKLKRFRTVDNVQEKFRDICGLNVGEVELSWAILETHYCIELILQTE